MDKAVKKETQAQKDGQIPQSGFVWDEASGYYYDAASGFYYNGNTGLYYDGNNGRWYWFNHQTQQYVPCTHQNDSMKSNKHSEISKGADRSGNNRKVVISTPTATVTSAEKAAATSLADAAQAAAAVGISTSLPAYELAVRPKPVRNSSGGSLMGVIRSSGRAVGRSEAWNLGPSGGAAESSFAYHQSFLRVAAQVQLFLIIRINILQVAGIGLLRGVYIVQLLQWMNLTWNMQIQLHNFEMIHDQEAGFKKSGGDTSMPFPSGVGGDEHGAGDPNANALTLGMSRAWGGRDVSGMIEPVQAQAMGNRAGLGSQQKKRQSI
ncbi:hypothetical protein SAY86_021382 [Trapa natans]|uniref:OCRE domain-containing protein n=1 Tax=Trapa natans TaxID=22666 RepID=A0AAN7M7V6_TRANT|nr:hypothetical protein SAY86_021382 [Trapa natans]